MILLCISIILLIIACSLWGIENERIANNIKDILFGFSTNLLGIIVTVSFVQFFIDKQDEKQTHANEVALIKRYDRFMTVLIKRYLMFYHCVITPINKRKYENPMELKTNFDFEDMCDLYEQSLYICEGMYEPSIVLFYKAERMLCDYMIDMVENIDFKFNEELLKILTEFIESSIGYDIRGAILGNINERSGNEKLTKIIGELIKDSSNEWVKKGKQGELKGNIMLPYVQLYELLKIEIELLIRYKKYVDEL